MSDSTEATTAQMACEKEQVAHSHTTTKDGQRTECQSSDMVVDGNGMVGDDGGSVPEAEKSKDPDRRRSKSGKRRSGFSRGRVSLTQLSKDSSTSECDLAGSELYKQIPVDLPPAQRLSLLSRLAMRHTLEILDREFEEVAGFDNFKAEAVESVGTIIDQLESDKTFEMACTTSSLAPNPVNLEMDNTISALKSSIKRLEKEDTDWDELVHKLETDAENAQQRLSQLDMGYTDVPEEVKTLSLSFLPPVPDTLRLPDVCTDTVADVKAISLAMDDYRASVELLSIVHKSAKKVMNTFTNTLEQTNSCQRCDPKESIQQLLTS